MIAILYKKILKPILFKFDPDVIHRLFVKIGVVCGKYPLFRSIINFLFGAPSGNKKIKIDGLTFKGPVLLSAGFDYNAYLSPILFYMGFAGEEVGSVTARASVGNPPPHLKRLIKSNSIQVYKGLKNDGVDAIIERIKAQSIPDDFILGISIARTNDQLSSDQSEGIKDYCYSFERLNDENIGDFYTINISCPNAFGGENFADPLSLDHLLTELKKIPSKKPMYIKMPINKTWSEFLTLLKIIDQHRVNGVVIGNLNKNYSDLDYAEEVNSEYRGGLSGKPCQKLSTELIKQTRKAYPKMTIFGCGGIIAPEDAMEKLEAGANLVQLITGMIFNGPHLIKGINSLYENRSKQIGENNEKSQGHYNHAN